MMSQKRILKMLIVLLLPLLVIVLVIFSNKPVVVDPLDPPSPAPTPAPSDWMTPGVMIQFSPVSPIAVKKVPARQITLPRAQMASMLRPTADGGCLAVSQEQVSETDTTGSPVSTLRVIRFKPDGGILWEHRYPSDPFRGYPVALCVWPDGGFAVSLRVSKPEPTLYETVDRLLYYSPDGTKAWQSDDSAMLAGSLEYLFALPDGAVISAGTIMKITQDGTRSENTVSLLRFEKNGAVSALREIGGTGYQLLGDADYSEKTGLVLTWRTDVFNELSGSGGSDQQRSKAACLTTDLRDKWIVEMAAGIHLFNIQALSDDEGLLLFGTQPVDSGSGLILGDSTVGKTRSTLFHVNEKGVTDWTYAAEDNSWIMNAAAMTDGRTIVGQYAGGWADGETSTIIVLSESGQSPRTLVQLPGVIGQLAATRDGGFTAILRQSVRPLPQPPYISSIWMDTAAFVAHYDRNLKPTWRRTIDQFKYDLRVDLIVATTDDRLLVG